jgi:hypothetical protein
MPARKEPSSIDITKEAKCFHNNFIIGGDSKVTWLILVSFSIPLHKSPAQYA